MSDKRPLKWTYRIAKKQGKNLFALVFSNAFFSALSIAFAFAIKGILDGAQQKNGKMIVSYSVMIISIVLFQFVFRLIINGLSEHIRGKLEMEIRAHLFCQILKKKQDKISVFHSGELINRLTSDTNIVSDGISTILPTVVSAVTRLLCAVVALVYLDWIFAVVFVVAGLIVFLIISSLRGVLKNLHRRVQETDGKSRSFMQECIEHLLAVKTFAVDDKIVEQSNSLQKDNFKVKMRRKNYSVLGHASYNLVFSAGYLFALIYGAVKILDSTISYGSLSAILQLVNNVQVPFASLSNIVPRYYAMIASAERLMEIECIENEPTEKLIDKWQIYSKFKGISVEGVSFSYDREVVLKNASAFIEKGDFVMITGTSGVGKSTLMKLLMGVYQVDSGRMVAKLEDGEIDFGVGTRSLFSYVPQGNMLFSGTLRDNVTFIKRDATEEEIERALAISQSKQFIDELPQGLDTVVGEQGVGLSEGQIQRIAIARAVLSDSPIILLDESTSALDEETERKLLDSFKQIEGITLIIISHKKAALNICNKKIKVKDKKFIEEDIG